MSLLEEVRFEARFKRLRYLLLARIVGEEPSLYTVRDKDALCYGRWHVALEQYA